MGDPDKRPSIHEVVERLKAIISKRNMTGYRQQNENFDFTDQITNDMASNSVNSSENSSHGELSRLILNFSNMSTRAESLTLLAENETEYLSTIVNEIPEFIFCQ